METKIKNLEPPLFHQPNNYFILLYINLVCHNVLAAIEMDFENGCILSGGGDTTEALASVVDGHDWETGWGIYDGLH